MYKAITSSLEELPSTARVSLSMILYHNNTRIRTYVRFILSVFQTVIRRLPPIDLSFALICSSMVPPLSHRPHPRLNDLSGFNLRQGFYPVLRLHYRTKADMNAFLNHTSVIHHGTKVNDAPALDSNISIYDSMRKNHHAFSNTRLRTHIRSLMNQRRYLSAGSLQPVNPLQPESVITKSRDKRNPITNVSCKRVQRMSRIRIIQLNDVISEL